VRASANKEPYIARDLISIYSLM